MPIHRQCHGFMHWSGSDGHEDSGKQHSGRGTRGRGVRGPLAMEADGSNDPKQTRPSSSLCVPRCRSRLVRDPGQVRLGRSDRPVHPQAAARPRQGQAPRSRPAPANPLGPRPRPPERRRTGPKPEMSSPDPFRTGQAVTGRHRGTTTPTATAVPEIRSTIGTSHPTRRTHGKGKQGHPPRKGRNEGRQPMRTSGVTSRDTGRFPRKEP